MNAKIKEYTLDDVCYCESSNIAQKDLEGNEGNYPIFGASGLIKNVDFYKQDKEYIAVVKDGAGIGKVFILPKNSSIIGTLQYILPKDNTDIKYLYYAMVFMNLSKYFSGSTIPHIYFKTYKKEKINLPTIDIQVKRASILSKIDEIINKYEQLIEKHEILIKSRFIEMFSSNNELILLGNLCNISRGASPRPISSYLTKEGINWIKIGDANKNSMYITSTKEKITKEGANQSRFVHKGDFILSNSMSYGEPYILDIDGCVHDGWLIISNYEKNFNKIFLYYLLKSDYIQMQMHKKAEGATVSNLNSDRVRELEVYRPDMEKQKEFASFVEKNNKSKFIDLEYPINQDLEVA